MALSATVEWDVRTTGSDSNAGGFRAGATGTDYSQQDSAQVTYTDLVIGGTNTQLTSAAHVFGAAHVGNIINITGGSGFTTGRYEIMSVSGTTATMDRAVGTASSTGGTGNLGGSVQHLATALGVMVTSNVVHLKAGTYAETVTVSATGPYAIIGYGSAHYDGGTKPLLTTSANTMLVNANWSGTITWKNISMSSTASTRNDGFNAAGNAGLILVDSILDGFRYGVMGDNGARGYFGILTVLNTEVKNCTTGGIYNWADTDLDSCYIHNNSGFGFNFNLNRVGRVVRCIIAANSGYGLTGPSGSQWWLRYCTIVGNTSGGVFNGNLANVENSIFYGNGGYGISLGSTPAMYTYANRNNAYGNNSSGDRNNYATGDSDVSLTANPFTASGSGDYSLNKTAGGGALCRLAGFPGPFPGGTSTGYLDIGAVQTSGGPGGAAGGGAWTFIG